MLGSLIQVFSDPEHHQGWWLMVAGLAACGSSLVIAVAAIFAWRQLREARVLRHAQLRPFVVIEFRPESGSLVIFLRISNLGSTMARGVRFSFDRPLTTTGGEEWNVMALKPLQDGIAFLPPGRVVEFVFDSWIGRDEKDDRYEVTVEYGGEGRTHFREMIDLDLGLFRNMPFVRRAGLHEIHEELKDIAHALKDFRATGGGLLALSPTDEAKRWEEWKRQPPAGDGGERAANGEVDPNAGGPAT